MYVVYDEITMPEGITERRLIETTAEPLHVLLTRYPELNTRVRRIIATGRWRSPEGIKDPVPPGDEDAFCLADGRMLVFRP